MDIFTYVAASNPYQAKSLLHKYGYSATNIKDANDLGVCLKKLVSQEGEGAFADIVECHPDKGVILEMYLPKKEEYKNCSGDCGCGCGCRNREQYKNASGDTEVKSASSTNQTSVFILAAALLLAAAIIVKN